MSRALREALVIPGRAGDRRPYAGAIPAERGRLTRSLLLILALFGMTAAAGDAFADPAELHAQFARARAAFQEELARQRATEAADPTN